MSKHEISIWSRTAKLPHRQPLSGNITAEAAVIGAGMAGILTAYLLQKQGVQVVVLEADRIAGGQTKNTTAKITSQHGLFFRELIQNMGNQKAKLYASAHEQAVDAFEQIIKEEGIDCDFKRLPSWLYSREAAGKDRLEAEARAAASLGIKAYVSETADLPFPVTGAVCFENQAQFHPLKFMASLARKLTIYEKTRVLKVKKHIIFTNHGRVTADHIVFACHYPFINVPGFYFLRLHQERSYCLGLSGAPALQAMYYSIDPQGLSLRQAEDTLLLGGGSHRTGKNKQGGEYHWLKAEAEKYFPGCRVIAQWSAQDCMSHDRLPFIGAYSRFRPYWHVASGFKKWGMTSSMVSAMILTDRICGRPNPWEQLFTPRRFHLKASAGSLGTDLYESTKGLLKGALHLPLRAEDLKPGQGGIRRIGLQRRGCYRDPEGRLHRIPVRCPHLGCQLEWNPTECTWDCPCHGSRYDPDGALIDNPAQENCRTKET